MYKLSCFSIIKYIKYFENAFINIKYKRLLNCIVKIALHPRFVVIEKCMAYKLSLFFTRIIPI